MLLIILIYGVLTFFWLKSANFSRFVGFSLRSQFAIHIIINNNKRVESPANQNWNRSIAEVIFDLKLNPIARLPTKMEKKGKFRESSCIIQWKIHPKLLRVRNIYSSV